MSCFDYQCKGMNQFTVSIHLIDAALENVRCCFVVNVVVITICKYFCCVIEYGSWKRLGIGRN
jgi:hypothetical protein